MKIRILSLGSVLLGCWAISASALDQSGERYAKMLASGGPGTIRQAADDIFSTAYSDQEVLDLAAQVLSELYLKNPDTRDYADATAWLCKALGNSGKGRYRQVLEQVAKSDIRRNTRKYCDKGVDNLPKNTTDSFQPGSVDVSRYKDGGPAYAAGAKGSSTKPAPAKAAASSSGGSAKKVDFSLVKEGMSMQEVDDILGSPTNQTTYMTGKQFQPFNFGARDLQRTKYLYKGVGHIVFSMKSGYNGVFRVIEIVPDPNESGYP
jgi:hypothetical protein